MVPELKEHIKEANFEEDFPLDNKDGAIASYLRCAYLTKVAGKILAPEKMDLVKKAVHLYGVANTAKALEESLLNSIQLKKEASVAKALSHDAPTALANLEGQATGSPDLEKLAEAAEAIFEQFPDQAAKSEVARTYACKGYFHKEAAVASLNARTRATGNPIFEKVAEIVDRSMGEGVNEKDVRQVCKFVTALDKKAGLTLKGFNFYKEAQLLKQAAVRSVLMLKLAGKKVPYESVQRFGMERIASVLGDDVAKGMNGDPVHDKYVLESLPLDSQRVLANVIR